MVMMRKRRLMRLTRAALMMVIAVVAVPPPLLAQAQSAARKGECDGAPPAKSATPVEKGDSGGSKNMGATGWSGGGLGGSHNETAPSGPTPDSRTVQPETARGLDLTKSDVRPASRC